MLPVAVTDFLLVDPAISNCQWEPTTDCGEGVIGNTRPGGKKEKQRNSNEMG
jgi:hypothetical protein